MKTPKNILVIVTRRIGDVLLATPLLHSLRVAWPDSFIDVLVYRGTESCLTANNDINRVLAVDERSDLSDQVSFMRTITGRYDMALSTQIGDRPTLYAFLAGKKRLGLVEKEFKQLWKRILLSGWKEFDNRDTHTVLMNLALADILGIEKHYNVIASWNGVNEERLRDLMAFEKKEETFAVIHPSPKFTYKMWRLEAWGQLASALRERGYRIVVTGGGDPNEQRYIDTLLAHFPLDTVNMSGQLDLGEVARLISDAAIYVGPDTCVTHMAAALGTPTVALYGPTNPVKWGPWPLGWTSHTNPYKRRGTPQRAGNVILLQGKMDCVPCAEEGCDRSIDSESRCLHSITVNDVLSAVDSFAMGSNL